MVVPDGEHRKAGVHGPEARIGAVELVLAAVVVEALGQADLVRAHPAGLAALGVVGLGVDVVPEVDHEVEVLLGHQRVGVVEAEGEVLAGEEGEAHRLARVRREGRAKAPDGARVVARGEAVEVLLVGVEAAHARLHRVVNGARGGHELARDHPAKPAVGGHLELDAPAAPDAGHTRPESDGAGRRVPGGDAFREAPAAQRRRAALALKTFREGLGGKDRSGGERTGSRHESAA